MQEGAESILDHAKPSGDFKGWVSGFFAAAAIIVLALVVAYIFMPQKPEEPVIMTIEPIQKPVEKIKKQATKKIANQTIDPPAVPVIVIPTTVETPIVKQPSIDDGFVREFDNQLSNFESKL
jgi:hypothetical protein